MPADEAPRCERSAQFVMVDRESGQIVPARCKANHCGYCGPVNARMVAGAIGLARPERFGTLTQVGDDWQTIRRRMKDLRYDLAATTSTWSWCWHVEPNPAGTGHHVHFWQRGSYIAQKRLARLADGAGLGRVADVRKWRADPRAAVTYGVKLAGVSYGLKSIDAEAGMDDYLTANGKRLVHASRGWWRDDAGARCTQREAMFAAGRASGRLPQGEWVLCWRHTLQPVRTNRCQEVQSEITPALRLSRLLNQGCESP